MDHEGHSGDWTAYIDAIENADRIIGELWTWLQQDPEYSGSTTVLITNDHGRHTTNFSGHGDQCDGCRTIQLLAVGPVIKAGHISSVQRSTPDIAPTIGRLLGFHTEYSSGSTMTEILSHDCNGNGLPDESDPESTDVGLFVNLLLSDSPAPTLVCMLDQNGDGLLNGADIQGFVDGILS